MQDEHDKTILLKYKDSVEKRLKVLERQGLVSKLMLLPTNKSHLCYYIGNIGGKQSMMSPKESQSNKPNHIGFSLCCKYNCIPKCLNTAPHFKYLIISCLLRPILRVVIFYGSTQLLY